MLAPTTMFALEEQRGQRGGESVLLGLLLALYPILCQFSSPISVLSLGEVVAIPVVAYLFLTGGFGDIRFDGLVAAFYAIPLLLCAFPLLTPNNYFDFNSVLTVGARMVFFFLFISAVAQYASLRVFSKAYIGIALCACGTLAIQFAAHYLTSFELPVMRSYSNILFSYNESMSAEVYYSTFGFRPAAFFTEPSYFAAYVSPLIAVLLFCPPDSRILPNTAFRHRFLLAIAMTGAECMTSSSAAVLTAAIIWGLFLVFPQQNEGGAAQGRSFPKWAIVVALGTCFSVLLFAGFLDALLERTLTGASLGSRVLRGFEIFGTMDLLHQLFGLGANNVQAYVDANAIATSYDLWDDAIFTSDLTNRLTASGLVGAIALAFFCLLLYLRVATRLQKVLVIYLAANFLFNAWQYSYFFAFIMAFILLLGQQSEGKVSQ